MNLIKKKEWNKKISKQLRGVNRNSWIFVSSSETREVGKLHKPFLPQEDALVHGWS